MDNLRWILILAGIGILVALYFSGRASRSAKHSAQTDRRLAADDQALDPLLGDETFPESFDNVDPGDFSRPGMPDQVSSGPSSLDFELGDLDVDDNPGRSHDSSPGFTSLAQKIESFGERLSPNRRQRVAASRPDDIDESTQPVPEQISKIITLHVMAPQNSVFDGARLFDVFNQRGYHFGDMNIFHSIHEGNTVFSIAKMVKPGFFDFDDIESFVTPGISFILQLPGPVPADVSFEVMVSEAYEMASELNGVVLDGDRNNMSKQTFQHMQEGVYEYMHRQKYFSNAPS